MATRGDLVRAIRNLPVQSGVAMRVFQLLDDPRSSAKAVGEAVATDPALLVNVLRLANSPMHGRQGRVSDPVTAVVAIGMTGLRAIVATNVAGLAVPGPEWRHALTTGACASVLSDGTGVPRLEAFTAGLLHDVGRAVQRQLQGVLLVPRDTHAVTNLELERRDHHLDHTEFGRVALESLQFPAHFIDAVASHHDEAGVAGRPLAAVVCAANHLAHVLEDDHQPEKRFRLLDLALDSLGRPPVDIEALGIAAQEEAGRWSGIVVGAR